EQRFGRHRYPGLRLAGAVTRDFPSTRPDDHRRARDAGRVDPAINLFDGLIRRDSGGQRQGPSEPGKVADSIGSLSVTRVSPYMKITIVADYDAMSQRAADIVTETLTRKPDCALCLPTGNTPLGMFRLLIDRIGSGELDASRAKFFLLDEYVGIDDDDPESLTRWLKAEFLT